MADLRPLGSEKLQGMDKIKRILEIAQYKETPKQNINENSSTDYTIMLADGYTYGIVKERLGYIIKKGLNESSLNYSEQIPQRKYFRSYSEAMKKLNLTAAELNRIYENEEGIALIGEQAGQKKKFVLKVPKKGGNKTPDVGGSAPEAAPPAPAAPTTPPPTTPPGGEEGPVGEPTSDTGGLPELSTEPTATPESGAPTGEPGSEAPTGEPDSDMGTTPELSTEPMGEPGGDMGTTPELSTEPMGEPEGGDDLDLEGGARPPSFKSIQRLTGKLSQRLRTIEKEKSLESDDIKYVINSIISALNLDNLEEDDRDDILSKFDEDESEYGAEGEGDLDMSSEDDFDMGGSGDMGAPEDTGGPVGEPMEMYNRFNESVVEKVLGGYFKYKPNEKKILEEKRKKEFLKNQLKNAEIKKEIRKMSESIEQMNTSFKLLNENAKFVGKTNKENLIFTKNGKQIKVTQRGRII
jgi:hypothetical protein